LQIKHLLRNILLKDKTPELRTSHPHPTTAASHRPLGQALSRNTFNVRTNQALKDKHPEVWRNNKVRHCLSLMVKPMTINNLNNSSLTTMYL
jgi:hypothetical protein